MTTSTKIYYYDSQGFNHDVVIPAMIGDRYVYTVWLNTYGNIRILHTNVFGILTKYKEDMPWFTLQDKDRPDKYYMLNFSPQTTYIASLIQVDSSGAIMIGTASNKDNLMTEADFIRFELVWIAK